LKKILDAQIILNYLLGKDIKIYRKCNKKQRERERERERERDKGKKDGREKKKGREKREKIEGNILSLAKSAIV